MRSSHLTWWSGIAQRPAARVWWMESQNQGYCVLSTKVQLVQTIYLKNPKTQKEMECRVTRFGPLYGKQVQVGVDFAQPTLTFWPAVFAPKSWKPVGTQPRAVA